MRTQLYILIDRQATQFGIIIVQYNHKLQILVNY